MEEIWKDIQGYEGLYQVSNLGRIKSLARQYYQHTKRKEETILKKGKDKKGYRQVCLSKERIDKTIKVHKLVWDAFGDRPRNGRILQIDHIDDNKNNNNINNLRLVSNQENCIKRSMNLPKTSKYTGVRLDHRRNKWQAYQYINGKQSHLGYYLTELEAHQAHTNFIQSLTQRI